MTKYHGIKSLTQKYAEKHNLSLRQAELVVRDMVDLLEEGLIDEEYSGIQFIDFITLKKIDRKARIGRNPKTKQEYPIPHRTVVKAVMGNNLASRIEKQGI